MDFLQKRWLATSRGPPLRSVVARPAGNGAMDPRDRLGGCHPTKNLEISCVWQEDTVPSAIFILLVVEPTHLKNMRKSNWIISPGRGENSKNI